jgi:thiamine transport system permease protein
MDRNRAQVSVRPDPNRLPPAFIAALGMVPATMLVVFYLWPLTNLIGRALGDGDLGGGLRSLATPQIWRVVVFTTWQALASTIGTVVIGLAPAYVVARYRFAGRQFLLGLLTAVFVLPTVVMAAAFIAVMPASLERSVWSILGAHIVFNLAVVVRVVGASWQHLDPKMEAAAATLGAGPVQVLMRVTLPMLRPAIIAAGSIIWLFTFTSFGVVRVLGGAGRATLEVEIWRRATQLGDLQAAALLSIAQLIVLAGLVAWSIRMQRHDSTALSLLPARPTRRPAGHAEHLVVYSIAGITMAIVAAPMLTMVQHSLRGPSGYSLAAWRNLGATEIRPGVRLGIDPWSALAASLQSAVWATVLAVVVGGLAALAIDAAGARGRFLDAGLMLPLATSAVTIGFGMLIAFARPPVDWRSAWWLVPVGHALVAVPFVVRTTLSVLASVDPGLRAAAATLGAGPIRAWREVVVPFLWRPLAMSAGIAAAISLGEFGATSLLSRRGTETLPIVIERLLSRTGSLLQAQAFALATILALLTTISILLIDTAVRPRSDESNSA